MLKKKLKIKSRDFKYVVAFAIIATIISSGVALRTLNPPPGEQYFAMWVLGANGLAEHYYPNDNLYFGIDEPLNWTIGVQNQMHAIEYVVVQVKLLNSSLTWPDNQTGTPSPVPPLLEFARVLTSNETWSIPFNWMLVAVTRSYSRETITIRSLSINQNQLNVTYVSAYPGRFRFVFELWFYDETSNQLVFSQPTNAGPRSVWTQIWFNAQA